jgi:hypothetical protein
MTAPQQSLPLRLAHFSLQLALRFWPEESRHWGHALTAELDEIEQPIEALQWALGGLMLFARASASHFLAWLKLPAGSRLSPTSLPPGTTAPILPKRSRLFTAAVLVATALLLFLPQTREAVSTVRASWHGFATSSSDLRALENLGTRAEKENDARTLAFVSLVLPHSARSTTFADRAVALDPTLVWIYASRVNARPGFEPPSSEGLARLVQSDAKNAVPELLGARVISEPRFTALIYRRTPSAQEIATSLTSDPAWMAHMDRAFRAPRYDNYFTRRWQLTTEVWNREPSLSPSVAFCSLWSHSLPDWLSIKTYANLLVHNAQEASVAGHPEQAENLLRQLDSFGRRLTEQSETDFERLQGLDLSRQAASEFRNLYLSAGKEIESKAADQRLQQIGSSRDTLIHSFRSIEPPQFRILERRAIFVQSSAVFAVLLVLAVALSLLSLELRQEKLGHRWLRLRGAICLAVDWTPVALLGVCIGLLWAFQPFASILRSARNVGSASAAWHTMHFEGLFILSTTLGTLSDAFTPYHFWQISTCVLVAFALFLLLRGFLRHKRA